MRFNDFVYDPDYDTYKEPVEGKTYISPQMADSFSDKSIRLVTRGIDQEETYEVAKVTANTKEYRKQIASML